jgi:hypothetical protein
MTPFRSLQIALAALLLIGSAWFVRATEDRAVRDAFTGGDWALEHLALGQLALANVVDADNGDNGGDNGDNGGDNGGNINGNGNSNGNGNGNSNSNGNDNFDNDNFDIFIPPPAGPSRPPEPVCTTPGKEATFTSADSKVTIRVFPTMSRSVKIQILQVIDFLAAPLPPGNLVGLLAYEIRATDCNGGALQRLPAEVNMAIHYSDLEAAGLDESKIIIGRLDQTAGIWVPVEKHATDTANNSTTATIQDVGFYMVYETR